MFKAVDTNGTIWGVGETPTEATNVATRYANWWSAESKRAGTLQALKMTPSDIKQLASIAQALQPV